MSVNKVVKLLKVKYSGWGIETSYHMMNETDKQYKSIDGSYGWIVKKDDIGIVSGYDEIYVVADEFNENQINETVELLVESILKRNQKKIDNITEQNNKLIRVYDKFKKGE